MFKIEWEFNGRKVRPEQIGKELMKSATKNAQRQLKRKIESMRCRKHGRTAKLILKPGSFDNMKVEGCCQEFILQVSAKLK